jgi:stage II sporulation protein D
MNLIRKQVPALSLAACAAALWWIWRFADSPVPMSERSEPLAVRSAAARPAERTIRVGVTSDPDRSVALEISEPFRVTAIGNNRTLMEAERLTVCTVTATSRGLKIGKKEIAATRVEIVPTRSPAVWIDGHQYRGRMRLIRQGDGKILAINVLPLDDYLASVVDSEMPAAFPEEARKAQAIVARTYALYQMAQAGPAASLDLYASTRSQKYLGFKYRTSDGKLLAGESAASRKIVEATKDRVCTYGGKLFCTYYCAVCGGGTVLGTEFFADAAPPLRSVPCDWCKEARLYRWTADVSKRDLQTDLKPLLKQEGRDAGNLRSVSLVRTKSAGVLPEFDLRGERQTVRVNGADLRQALGNRGLYSPRFTIEDRGKSYWISGRGHGHGVGLCQWGARGMALAGKTCDEIVQHYYVGAKVTVQTH